MGAGEQGRSAAGGSPIPLHAPLADAARTGPRPWQWATAACLAAGAFGLLLFRIDLALRLAHAAVVAALAHPAAWRLQARGIGVRPGRVERLATGRLPRYAVIVPLHREAAMARGLVAALNGLDYPAARLQVLIALEADDPETLAAIRRCPGADRFEIVVAGDGGPKTKPRACNLALARVRAEHVVVYDAEDRPHPLQLREAAARFAAAPRTLACLQAPLRIADAGNLLQRQFALEYAAQFEVLLPALHRLGAPFPLGGTSNHFRTEVLRAVGGWDAWNVTEDADLGFRLAAHGFRAGLLRTPTWESAPAAVRAWLPQRRRWIKGYMQTWGVHMRAPVQPPKRLAALQITVGLSILSAFAHGPASALMAGNAAAALLMGREAGPAGVDLALLLVGWGAAAGAMALGARRAGLRLRLIDLLIAPGYWSLQSWAGLLAAVQLCTRPHYWDKTIHQPARSSRIAGALDETPDAGLRPAA